VLAKDLGTTTLRQREASIYSRVTENEDMVQTRPPHGANEPFHERMLPRTVGRREDFIAAQALYLAPERGAH
jgi:hypothetical protein